mmetsp:Transcript_146409/g.365127  ORF Transcript_146409/g.365127 Transcript_146409/m.365127 type:complete len:256 (-) Transcript_146409:411-1178(-)
MSAPSLLVSTLSSHKRKLLLIIQMSCCTSCRAPALQLPVTWRLSSMRRAISRRCPKHGMQSPSHVLRRRWCWLREAIPIEVLAGSLEPPTDPPNGSPDKTAFAAPNTVALRLAVVGVCGDADRFADAMQTSSITFVDTAPRLLLTASCAASDRPASSQPANSCGQGDAEATTGSMSYDSIALAMNSSPLRRHPPANPPYSSGSSDSSYHSRSCSTCRTKTNFARLRLCIQSEKILKAAEKSQLLPKTTTRDINSG